MLLVVKQLAAAVGTSESALRLLLVILLAYVPATLYAAAVHRATTSTAIRNAFLLMSGLALSWFYCGVDTAHGVLTTVVAYLIMLVAGAVAGRRDVAAAAVFIWSFGYLLWGYYATFADEYDISWTMPQCVLCLRMIGLAWDYCDGARLPPVSSDDDSDEKSKRMIAHTDDSAATGLVAFPHTSPLRTLPSLLTVLGYAYFPSTFLIGPQFSFDLYQSFLADEHVPGGVCPPGRAKSAAKSLAIGLLYLVATVGLGRLISTHWLLTEEYMRRGFGEKLMWVWLAGRSVIQKYIATWKISEGATIISGISFAGFDKSSAARWDGLNNVDELGFETAQSLGTYVAVFNRNTNAWSKRYIFKRLKFLGNKNASLALTLSFLALWHGFHLGYFICFACEFLEERAEQSARRLMTPFYSWVGITHREATPSGIQNTPFKTVLREYLLPAWWWLASSFALYYPLVAFDLLAVDKITTVWRSVSFFGTWIALGLLSADTVLSSSRPKPAKRGKEDVPDVPEKSQPPVDKGSVKVETVVSGLASRTVAVPKPLEPFTPTPIESPLGSPNTVTSAGEWTGVESEVDGFVAVRRD